MWPILSQLKVKEHVWTFVLVQLQLKSSISSLHIFYDTIQVLRKKKAFHLITYYSLRNKFN